MKDFWKVMVKYISPYYKYLGGSVFLNILSAILNVFSFSLLIPVLQIVFNTSEATYEFIPWHSGMSFHEITNNAYYYISQYIAVAGESKVLLVL